MKVARIYLRVSADDHGLKRQSAVVESARADGYYIAGVYAEKASGARPDRPVLFRMVEDLQPGDVVVAERIDRISCLPFTEAELLVASIRAEGARLSVPGVVYLSDLAAEAESVTKIVLESVRSMLLKLAVQMALDDYELRRVRQRQGIDSAMKAGRYKGGRTPNVLVHARVVALRLAGCSIGLVKIAWAAHQNPLAAPAALLK